MKLFSTLIQRIAALLVVLTMTFSINAADRTFATIADMNAATDLASGDKVTITGDVVIEYIMESYYVLKDKSGTATCVNYNYNFKKFQEERLAGLEEYPETPPVKPGDVFKKYTAKYGFAAYTTMPQLEPTLDMDMLEFVDFTAEYIDATDYKPTTTKTTVRQLLDNPDDYIGKIVSLDEAKTVYVEKKFASYLVQGEDTLKNFRISGLDQSVYPNTLIITQALCTSKYGGGCQLQLTQNDYISEAFTEIKSLKATALTENIPLDITAQVLHKEIYNGKTYITIMNGSGKYLVNYSAIRMLLNTENDIDKTLKIGDYINLKTSTAKFSPQVKEGNNYILSLLTIDEHETTFISEGEVTFLPISPEEISMLNYYEYLPATLNGYVTLSGNPTAEQIAHNIAPATFTSVYGDSFPILLDLTYLPKSGSSFIITGILDIPLWMKKSDKPVIVPLSEKGFMANSYSFNSIAEMVTFGAPTSSVISYGLNNPVTITGVDTISAVGDEDQTQYIIFVADETGSLLLKGTTSYNVGDAITSITGFYSDAVKSSISNDGIINFGVSNYLELDSTGVELVSTEAIKIKPIEITIAQLLSTDEYASKLVKLTNFTYKAIEEVVQDVTVTRHFIYQGTDSIAVDASFELQEDKSEIVGNYYLNGYYTSIIPTIEIKNIDAIENITSDNALFVTNSVIYAENAEIEVYDIMGRLIIAGHNAVAIESANHNILIVKTKYIDGQVYVTKITNR